MPDRSAAPSFTRDLSFKLLPPGQRTLNNGLKIFSIAGGSQPVIRIELLIAAGRWYETAAGASYFAAQMLPKGTTRKSSFDIAEIFDQYGAHLEINPGHDIVSITLYTLSRHLAPTLALLQELLVDATFPEKELQQLKSIYLQNLRVNHEKTSFLASKLFRKNLFGENHPYGRETETTDVESLSRASIVDHVRQNLHDMIMIISGDAGDAHLAMIEKVFSGSIISKSVTGSIATSVQKPFRDMQEKAGSIQSSLRVGREMISRSHKDYAGVLFVNHILGGYFGSRLMKNIREDKGFTYGIHASLHTLQHKSYVVIGADVNKENLEATFEEIRKELKQLRTAKISAEELETARNHFIGSLQSEMTTPFAHADKLKTILLFDLGQNFYQDLINTIDRLSIDDLNFIAEQYFQEDTFFEVAVG